MNGQDTFSQVYAPFILFITVTNENTILAGYAPAKNDFYLKRQALDS